MSRIRGVAFFAATVLTLFANSIFGQQISSGGSIYRLAAGTRIPVKLDVELSSSYASKNDTFIARTSSPVMIDGAVALPEGTIIEGEVVDVREAAFGGRDGEIDIAFRTMRFSDTTERRLATSPVKQIGRGRNALISGIAIGGGTIGGYAIGSASGGDKRWIGAGLGAALGASFSLLRKGQDASIRPEQTIYVVLEQEVVLPVADI